MGARPNTEVNRWANPERLKPEISDRDCRV